MKIFAFEYCHCIYDSGFIIKSLHKTKRGAYKSMIRHKNESFYAERDLGIDPSEIGSMELWRVKEYIVLD